MSAAQAGVYEGGATQAELPPPIPVIRLFADDVVVDDGPVPGAAHRVERLPLVALSFDYGGMRIAAGDLRDRVFVASAGGTSARPRALRDEDRARRVLERLGAIELGCLDGYGVSPDAGADYLVTVEGDLHEYCAFTARAVPELEREGFRVEIDADYPYQVVPGDVRWYADVEPLDGRPDWFGLELGVELDGARVNLLPILVRTLEDRAEGDSLSALARSSRRMVALPITDTHHLTVTPERLRALLRVVVELYEGPSAETLLLFDARRASAIARLSEAFSADGGVRLSDPGRIVPRARSRPEPEPMAAPAGLRATLRPYQEIGLAFLQGRAGQGAVLADDMGLGKTLQTIAHLLADAEAGRAEHPSLVVAPTSLVENWIREVKKFAPSLSVIAYHRSKRRALLPRFDDVDLVVTSYPILVRDEDELAARDYHAVILDEAQAIKNRRSLAHKACVRLRSEQRVCLSGTPVENHLGELHSMFEFLQPGLLGGDAQFRSWYRQPIEQRGDEVRLEALREVVAPFLLRRHKEDVARDLPPKTELLRPVELEGKQRDLYEHIRIGAHDQVRMLIRKKGLTSSTIGVLDALMKLRQVCCDPRLVKMDAARFVKRSAKYEALMELLEEQLAAGRRALVFSQFTTMLGLIGEGLTERGIEHLSLTGASRQRQRLVDRFEGGEADVFLISLKAGGTGLNLVSADTVVHYEPWWNPQAQAQATDRAYRIGQTKPVFVHHLYVAGSVEERMIELQRRKRQLADAILAGGARLSEEDVDRLFSPLPK